MISPLWDEACKRRMSYVVVDLLNSFHAALTGQNPVFGNPFLGGRGPYKHRRLAVLLAV